MTRTHTQSNSNAGLTLACKAGKSQSYFSNQNGDMLTGARRELHGGRPLALDGVRAQQKTVEHCDKCGNHVLFNELRPHLNNNQVAIFINVSLHNTPCKPLSGKPEIS